MRGLSIEDNRFRGRHLLLMSAEYRHFLIQDMDWDFWFFRLRDLQGAFFSDAGNITNTLQEHIDGVPSSNLGDLFNVTDFQTDFGYGIRFHVEYLGVNPGLFRFDIAKSISEWSEGVRFYFGVTQSF